MVNKAVGYGYIDGEVGRDEEVLVIMRRSKTNPQESEYDIKHFTTKLSNNTSNVYLYNAIWNTRNDLGGACILTSDYRKPKSICDRT